MSNNVFVFGDLILDKYIQGRVSRISPEAPVPVLLQDVVLNMLGGASNVVNNLVALGNKVHLCGAIGEDDSGEILSKEILELRLESTLLLKSHSRITTTKTRLVDNRGQQLARLDYEKKTELTNEELSLIDEWLRTSTAKCDLILISDYNKGFVSEMFMDVIRGYCLEKGCRYIVDPKGTNYKKYQGAYLLTPNQSEAQEVLKVSLDDDFNLKMGLKSLKNSYGLKESIITLGEKGIAWLDTKADQLKLFPALAKEVFDVTGAGDTVIATIATYLMKGHGIETCLYYANVAASIVVTKSGCSTTDIESIESGKLFSRSVYNKILNSVNDLEKQDLFNKKIVFTNGCFDIIHAGHISLLYGAKAKGDVLIVGVNSNSSVKGLKGESRPIVDERDRALVVASIECVDYVILFEEETPLDLLKQIEPQVLVKGGDYSVSEVIGSEYALETVIVPFIEGQSTTSIVEKIRKI